MSLTVSPIKINVSAASFTPAGGTLTPITGVKSVTLNYNLTDTNESADMDYYNTFDAVTGVNYTLDLDLIRPQVLAGISPGTIGTFMFTQNDGRNGAVTGGGATIYTVINAVYRPKSMSTLHRQPAHQAISFGTFSSDGATSPVSSAAA